MRACSCIGSTISLRANCPNTKANSPSAVVSPAVTIESVKLIASSSPTCRTPYAPYATTASVCPPQHLQQELVRPPQFGHQLIPVGLGPYLRLVSDRLGPVHVNPGSAVGVLLRADLAPLDALLDRSLLDAEQPSGFLYRYPRGLRLRHALWIPGGGKLSGRPWQDAAPRSSTPRRQFPRAPARSGSSGSVPRSDVWTARPPFDGRSSAVRGSSPQKHSSGYPRTPCARGWGRCTTSGRPGPTRGH